jgi:Xaa-Pro aminopeptidase
MDRRSEVQRKLETVRTWLDRERLGACMLASQNGFAWISAGGQDHVSLSGDGGVASVLVTSEDAYLLTPNIERRRMVDEEIEGLPFEPVEWEWHDLQAPGRLVADLCDPSRAVADLPAYGLRQGGPGLVRLRITLLPPEVERYRRLGKDAAVAVEGACRMTSVGDTELDVAARVAAACQERDIQALVNLVAAGERIARYRHPLPTHNRVAGTLLVALTGRRHGLHASLTRMISFGPADPETARRHAAVTRVDAAVISASSPGTTLGDAVSAALRQYADEGFAEEWRLHHQGGLTGYAGREIFATPAEPHRLEVSQALAWNPSITRVKSEDTVLVTAGMPEILTQTAEWPLFKVDTPRGPVERPALLEMEA